MSILPRTAAGWQGIESAPRDGTHVQLATDDSVVPNAFYTGTRWIDYLRSEGRVGGLTEVFFKPLYWKPLEQPPGAAAEQLENELGRIAKHLIENQADLPPDAKAALHRRRRDLYIDTPPAAERAGEAVAYLKQWRNDGKDCVRVDLSPECEPWLTYYSPTITPLYASPAPAQGYAEIDAAICEFTGTVLPAVTDPAYTTIVNASGKLLGRLRALSPAPEEGYAEGDTPTDRRVIKQANLCLAQENELLRQALRFYAHGQHFDVDHAHWDSVSGEPENWLERTDSADCLEDGGIARRALSGETIDWDEDGPPPEYEGEPVMRAIAAAEGKV